MRRAIMVDAFTVVWLVLVLTTLFSGWVGESTHGRAGVGGAIVLAVAFFKVRLIGIHFMELGSAPAPLRTLFEGWIFFVGSGLIASVLWT